MSLFKPTLRFSKDHKHLERAEGVFRRKRVLLDDVSSVVGVSRDRLTYEEIFVFLVGPNVEFVMSQFDENFRQVVNELSGTFPGIEKWTELSVGELFNRREQELWRKG